MVSLEKDALPAQICKEWERHCPRGNDDCLEDANELCDLIEDRLDARDEILRSMTEIPTARKTSKTDTASASSSLVVSSSSNRISTTTTGRGATSTSTELHKGNRHEQTDSESNPSGAASKRIGLGAGIGIGGLLVILLVAWLFRRHFKISVRSRKTQPHDGGGIMEAKEGFVKPELADTQRGELGDSTKEAEEGPASELDAGPCAGEAAKTGQGLYEMETIAKGSRYTESRSARHNE